MFFSKKWVLKQEKSGFLLLTSLVCTTTRALLAEGPKAPLKHEKRG